MVVLLLLLALGMIATGAASMIFGLPIIQVERGWAMVIAGSVAASGGAVLLGIALVAQRLARIAQETIRVRDRLSHLTEILDEGALPLPPAMGAPDPGPPAAEPPVVAAPPPPLAAPHEVAPAPPPLSVVGQYSSGGVAYTMFSDGSILADTPAGQRRYGSIEELRSSVTPG